MWKKVKEEANRFEKNSLRPVLKEGEKRANEFEKHNIRPLLQGIIQTDSSKEEQLSEQPQQQQTSGHQVTTAYGLPAGLTYWLVLEDDKIKDKLGQTSINQFDKAAIVQTERGTGFRFNKNGHIDMQHSNAFANQTFTAEASVKPETPIPNDDYVGSIIVQNLIDLQTITLLLSWRATDNKFVFGFGKLPEQMLVSNDSFPPNKFYHVAASYDGNTYKLYVDGKLQAEKQLTQSVNYLPNSIWAIGGSEKQVEEKGYPRTWNGVIQDFRIYNKALEAAEIADLNQRAINQEQDIQRQNQSNANVASGQTTPILHI